jgi:hypothetical protein
VGLNFFNGACPDVAVSTFIGSGTVAENSRPVTVACLNNWRYCSSPHYRSHATDVRADSGRWGIYNGIYKGRRGLYAHAENYVFFVDGQPISTVDSFTHLGHLLSSDMSDDEGIISAMFSSGK